MYITWFNSIFANPEWTLHSAIDCSSFWKLLIQVCVCSLAQSRVLLFQGSSGSIFVVCCTIWLHVTSLVIAGTQTGLLSDCRSRADSPSQAELDATQCPLSPAHNLTEPRVGASILLWHSGDCGDSAGEAAGRAELRQFSCCSHQKTDFPSTAASEKGAIIVKIWGGLWEHTKTSKHSGNKNQ